MIKNVDLFRIVAAEVAMKYRQIQTHRPAMLGVMLGCASTVHRT